MRRETGAGELLQLLRQFGRAVMAAAQYHKGDDDLAALGVGLATAALL